MTGPRSNPKKKKRFLFVCYGNICRSPMAEAIARKRLGGAAEVASAGIGATGGPAVPEAVEVMRTFYGIDISGHIARPVGVFELKTFDFIIALDPTIKRHLREIWGVPDRVLFGWDIEDPLGADVETFRQTALKIERRLEEFLAAAGLGA
ncbi:MAG TPA: low molecular weight phosphatase family protein [Candidatus Bathyarchaeia archaeon]|nr:low molecular weight phosphatase family protein [Candidatus Bathyarchaeia archaeon]